MSDSDIAHRLGVCSWSLRPRSPADLIDMMNKIGIRNSQLALDPVVNDAAWADTRERLSQAEITVVSGMFGTRGEDYTTLETIRATGGVVPDSTWSHNWEHVQKVIEAARALEIGHVSFHAGFLPESHDDPLYEKMLDRLSRIADAFAAADMKLAFETGQEEAGALRRFLKSLDKSNVGVNFDPANMILYGKGDPVAAVHQLSSYIMQVHIKDAAPSLKPGDWGQEMKAGEGAVDWPSFFSALDQVGFSGYCCIEREAGESRIEDICAAKDLVLHGLL